MTEELDIQDSLLAEINASRDLLSLSMRVFQRAADSRSPDESGLLVQTVADQSAARERLVAALHSFNQFLSSLTIPAEVRANKIKAKRAHTANT